LLDASSYSSKCLKGGLDFPDEGWLEIGSGVGAKGEKGEARELEGMATTWCRATVPITRIGHRKWEPRTHPVPSGFDTNPPRERGTSMIRSPDERI